MSRARNPVWSSATHGRNVSSASRRCSAYGGVVTQEDFPALAESARQQALVEFGPRADRPD
jgi:hypothetical protein